MFVEWYCLVGLVVCCFPVQHNVSGTITDFIGNDDGFGIKIDGVAYWLTYDNINFNNTDMRSLVNHTCDLSYTSFGVFLPRGCGGPALYMHTDNLTIWKK